MCSLSLFPACNEQPADVTFFEGLASLTKSRHQSQNQLELKLSRLVPLPLCLRFGCHILH